MICSLVRAYSKKPGRNAAGPVFRTGLSALVVRARPGHPTQGLLKAGHTVFPCALGRGGITSNKREGDGGTPLGAMRLILGYVRRDHLAPSPSKLQLKPIGSSLGWCEVPDDRNYNRPVRMPYAASHERMRRDDKLYDVCIVLDWNLSPRRRGRGSAIFFHLARPGFEPTAGCVAVTERTMQRLLPHLRRRTVMRVVR
ncbi:L,D-transpeptidase family protein [Oryzicola mucosus]|uniref:L,D-transpeptidase n=1 Tax=Oryzicola mucosus TaxID=2767425 RepID=A0A8J6U4A4_9HYPH|nr:L,D-transpeptidase [Oryzicola mucosus]